MNQATSAQRNKTRKHTCCLHQNLPLHYAGAHTTFCDVCKRQKVSSAPPAAGCAADALIIAFPLIAAIPLSRGVARSAGVCYSAFRTPKVGGVSRRRLVVRLAPFILDSPICNLQFRSPFHSAHRIPHSALTASRWHAVPRGSSGRRTQADWQCGTARVR